MFFCYVLICKELSHCPYVISLVLFAFILDGIEEHEIVKSLHGGNICQISFSITSSKKLLSI